MAKNMLKRGISSQLLAGLYMLKDCIDRCPDIEWNESHNDYPFCQIVFHILLDCDYNLCESDVEFREQKIHQNNREIFADYRELEELIPQRFYSRDFINQYYEYCRKKVNSVIEAKNNDELIIPNSDIYKNMTKLERYINAIRHIQHHTAQLGLRLQFVTGKEMDWVSRGY